MKNIYEMEFDNSKVEVKIVRLEEIKDINGKVNHKNLINVVVEGKFKDEEFKGRALFNVSKDQTNAPTPQFLKELSDASTKEGTMEVSLNSMASTSKEKQITTFLNQPLENINGLDLTTLQ